jgi:hypothetical protein
MIEVFMLDYYPGTKSLSKILQLPPSNTLLNANNSCYNLSPSLKISHCIQLQMIKMMKEGPQDDVFTLMIQIIQLMQICQSCP